MADSVAGEVEGDYSVVKVQLAAIAGDDVKRPTKGTQVVWGGAEKGSPWAHLAELIEKGGGSVTYTYIHAADLKEQPEPEAQDEGDAPKDEAGPGPEAEPPPKKDEKKDEKAPPSNPGGMEGHGDLFEFGTKDFKFNGNPARIWAHPHTFMSGPRPLIILLHGINKQEALDYPLMNEKGIHIGKIASALIDAGKATPVIIVAPTEKRNDVWGKFDYEGFITAVAAKLKDLKVEVDYDQMAVVGHSAAGGSGNAGINLAAAKKATFHEKPLKVLGMADTRAVD